MKSKISVISIFVLLFTIILFQNCNQQGFRLKTPESTGVPISNRTFNVTPEELRLSLFSAAKTLAGRLPTSSETEMAVKGVEAFTSVVEGYMGTKNFIQNMAFEHKNYFGISVPESDNGDASRLGAYLIDRGEDYRKFLTTEICVNSDEEWNLTVQPFCQTFPDLNTAKANAAGLLTSKSYLMTYKRLKAFNFGLVAISFQKLSCQTYPDLSETGLRVEEISNTLHPFSQDGKCFSCHTAINPKATVFFKYDPEGNFTEDIGSTTNTDSVAAAKITDLLAPGVNPRIDGIPLDSVKAWGELLANSPRFANCMAQRYINYLLAAPIDTVIPNIESIGKEFAESNYNVKKLILTIVTSEFYLKRDQGAGIAKMSAEDGAL